MLRYAHEHGCPWDEFTFMHAAEGGHLEVLRYAHEHGCPWDWGEDHDISDYAAHLREYVEALRTAARGGPTVEF